MNDFSAETVRLEERLLQGASGDLSHSFEQHSLFWHQDRISARKIDYLYFLVVEATSLLEHTICLGKASAIKKSALEPIPGAPIGEVAAFANSEKDARVNVIEDIPGISGAGYFVNQNFRDADGAMIVHTHSGYKCFINRYDPEISGIERCFADLYGDDAEKALHPKNNMFSSETYPSQYERQQRLKVVIRIKRL